MLPRAISSNIEVIRVLHVDDDPNQFEFIKFFLNQVDLVLQVNCVSTPDEVMTELDTGNYDCLVTDFQMPIMNGIDLARKIREKHSIPIILYTGQGSEEVAEAAFTVGVDDYLRKEMDPSHYQVLAKRIRHVVEKKQAESLYQTIVEQTRDALSIFIDGKIVFANQSTLKLFGFEKIDDIFGSNPFKNNDNWDKVLEPGFHEIRHLKKRNEEMVFEISSSPLIYNGKDAIVCFIRDITDKRNLELEKKVSQERFRSLVELAPEGIATFNTMGYMTFLNKAFCDLTGFTREDLIGKHITNLKTLRKRDLLKYIRVFTTVLQGNVSPPMEFIYNRKDGSRGAGEAYLGLVDVDGKKEMLLMASDITSRKIQESQFKSLLEYVPEGIIEIDKQGFIRSINQSTSAILEATKNNIIGDCIYETNILDDVTKNEIRKISIKTLHNGKNHKAYTQIHKNGEDYPIEINSQPIIMDDEIFGVQLVIKDTKKQEKAQHQEPAVLENQSILDYSNIRQELKSTQMNIQRIKNSKQYNEISITDIEEQIKTIINKLDNNERLTLETPFDYDPQLTDITKT